MCVCLEARQLLAFVISFMEKKKKIPIKLNRDKTNRVL